MSTDRVHMCFTTSGLDELPRREQRDMHAVARTLAKAGRFSVFEATANQTIARTMTSLATSGWFEFDPKAQGYPWTVVKLTDAGRAALKLEETP